MSHHTENDRLSSLRARTDGQLIALIRKDLEEGLRLAHQAAPGDKIRAQSAWDEASLLLPRVDGMSQNQRRELNEQLERLRLALDASRLDRPLKVRAAGG
jgi:ABC-type phosphate transport system auxiliary subunit